MIKRTILALLLCSAFVGTTIHAASEAETTVQMSETEKCKNLKKQLLGNRFELKRVAAYLGTWLIGNYISDRVHYRIYRACTEANHYQLAYLFNEYRNQYRNLALIAIHNMYAKQVGVSKLATLGHAILYGSSNPLGLTLYTLCSYYFLSQSLMNILEEYDAAKIPTCVKPAFDLLAKEFTDNDGDIKMNTKERIAFVTQVLKKLNTELGE